MDFIELRLIKSEKTIKCEDAFYLINVLHFVLFVMICNHAKAVVDIVNVMKKIRWCFKKYADIK